MLDTMGSLTVDGAILMVLGVIAMIALVRLFFSKTTVKHGFLGLLILFISLVSSHLFVSNFPNNSQFIGYFTVTAGLSFSILVAIAGIDRLSVHSDVGEKFVTNTINLYGVCTLFLVSLGIGDILSVGDSFLTISFVLLILQGISIFFLLNPNRR